MDVKFYTPPPLSKIIYFFKLHSLWYSIVSTAVCFCLPRIGPVLKYLICEGKQSFTLA